MNSFPVGIDPSGSYFPKFIIVCLGLLVGFRTPLDGFFIGFIGIIHPQGQYFNAVPMLFNMFRNGMIGAEGGGEYQPNFILAQYIGSPVSNASFRTSVGLGLKSKSRFIEMCRLFRIAYIKLNKVGTVNR